MGNLIRAGTCRLCGAARDNAPVCSVATGEPATVSDGRYATARAYENLPSSPRRFPPPWTVEELDACFVVIDSAEQKLAYVYFEE